jgi:enoyl-CoA hydratase/carnithine racemase
MAAHDADRPTYEQVGVRVDIADTVARITLCRPEVRNAQTPAMWQVLAEIGEDLDDDVRVVVLAAEGVSFSAGLDRAMFDPHGSPDHLGLADLARLDEGRLDATIATFQDAFRWWRRPSFVSVAAVQGHAVGAGFQLALACDLRVVADDARFSMRETSLGLVPDLGGTQPLVEQVGYSRALEICVTGRWVDAGEAAALGLATVVVPRPELEQTTDDLVAALLSAPADAVRATTSLLRGATHRGYDDQLGAERAAQVGRIRALAAQASETSSA